MFSRVSTTDLQSTDKRDAAGAEPVSVDDSGRVGARCRAVGGGFRGETGVAASATRRILPSLRRDLAHDEGGSAATTADVGGRRGLEPAHVPAAAALAAARRARRSA